MVYSLEPKRKIKILLGKCKTRINRNGSLTSNERTAPDTLTVFSHPSKLAFIKKENNIPIWLKEYVLDKL